MQSITRTKSKLKYPQSVHCQLHLSLHQQCIIHSIQPSYDECQETPGKFPSTNYAEKYPSQNNHKIPHDITLTLHQMIFLGKGPGDSNGVTFMVKLLSG